MATKPPTSIYLSFDIINGWETRCVAPNCSPFHSGKIGWEIGWEIWTAMAPELGPNHWRDIVWGFHSHEATPNSSLDGKNFMENPIYQ